MNYCDECREIIEKEDVFCLKCGSRIDSFSSQSSTNQNSQTWSTSSKQKQSSNKRDLFFWSLVILTFIIAFLLIPVMITQVRTSISLFQYSIIVLILMTLVTSCYLLPNFFFNF